MTSRMPRPYPNLYTWRTSNHLNQREAAELLGLTQSTYSRIETGRQPAKGKRARAIMETTGVPLEVLVGAA